ncbi:MAG: tetratricopeptide repeat protein [Pseudomonadota bacterium]
MRSLVLLVAVCPIAAVAECPPAPDHTAELVQLFDAARSAPNETMGRAHGAAMWEIWTDAPDEPAQALLDTGLAAIRVGDFVSAFSALNRLVEYCPDYSEGWNQRAFAHYLSGDYARALPDLETAVDLNPVHVGALAGLALTLIKLGRDDEAQGWLKAALELNPWLAERHLLKDAPGSDL